MGRWPLCHQGTKSEIFRNFFENFFGFFWIFLKIFSQKNVFLENHKNLYFQLNTQFPAYDISPPMILTESADRLGEVLKVSDTFF